MVPFLLNTSLLDWALKGLLVLIVGLYLVWLRLFRSRPQNTEPDPYYEALPRHANARIPSLGGRCDEEDGAYMALGDISRFFFDPARTPDERAQVLRFLNHSLEVGGERTETAIVLEVFWDAYDHGEPLTSLFKEQLSPTAWAVFETHRNILRRQGLLPNKTIAGDKR